MSLDPSQPPETLSLEIIVKDAIAAVNLVKRRIGHRPLVLAPPGRYRWLREQPPTP